METCCSEIEVIWCQYAVNARYDYILLVFDPFLTFNLATTFVFLNKKISQLPIHQHFRRNHRICQFIFVNLYGCVGLLTQICLILTTLYFRKYYFH